jgi:hypothetical protein
MGNWRHRDSGRERLHPTRQTRTVRPQGVKCYAHRQRAYRERRMFKEIRMVDERDPQPALQDGPPSASVPRRCAPVPAMIS